MVNVLVKKLKNGSLTNATFQVQKRLEIFENDS